MNKELKAVFKEGMRDGVPIGLGYFAVAFSLGIAAHNIGMSVMEGSMMSLLNLASAGEYAGISAIKDNATYIEIAILILVTNARYLLMSCALSQKLSPTLPLRHRLFIGYGITDEIFGISVARSAPLNPYYVYGSYTTTVPMWTMGTALGIMVGNILPEKIVIALTASIFGMFIAIVIPPCKKNRTVLYVVFVSFILSTAIYFIPLFKKLSESLRIIILTVVISLIFAYLFPRKDKDE